MFVAGRLLQIVGNDAGRLSRTANRLSRVSERLTGNCQKAVMILLDDR